MINISINLMINLLPKLILFNRVRNLLFSIIFATFVSDKYK